MFPLQNFRGSCWINACLQAIFRLPEVQERYNYQKADPSNPIDVSLQKIWNTKGQDGLKDFFECVRTIHMPAGQNTGDSHELLQLLCDRLGFLDNICRFKIANSVECNTCKAKQLKEDTVIEFDLASEGQHIPITQCISKTVTPHVINDWKCEKCHNKGCTKQQLIGSFPKAMVFHMVSPNQSVDYSSVLLLNGKKYVLMSVICYSGSHWWTRGRNMPPGSPWYTFDDTHVINHGSKQFPVSNMMRILIYYRLED